MCVHLVHRDIARAQERGDVVSPSASDAEGGEVRDEERGAESFGGGGDGSARRVAGDEVEGHPDLVEGGGELAESAEHEAVLSRAGVGELGNEVEDDGEGTVGALRDGEGVGEGPVVVDALVATHPVDDRAVTYGVGAAAERADATRVAPHALGRGNE